MQLYNFLITTSLGNVPILNAPLSFVPVPFVAIHNLYVRIRSLFNYTELQDKLS